jgi:hypothetical protein
MTRIGTIVAEVGVDTAVGPPPTAAAVLAAAVLFFIATASALSGAVRSLLTTAARATEPGHRDAPGAGGDP